MMSDQMLQQASTEFEQTLTHLKDEYAKLQIGRASASLVDSIQVEAYGTNQPIKAMANISIPDAKTVQIQPWDKGQLGAIEKAIQNSDLNIAPVNDGIAIRLVMPMLTEERRKDLSKIVGKLAEDARITVRNVRQKSHDKAREMQKSGEMTEDQLHGFEKRLQESVDKVNSTIEELSKAKEKDVMTV